MAIRKTTLSPDVKRQAATLQGMLRQRTTTPADVYRALEATRAAMDHEIGIPPLTATDLVPPYIVKTVQPTATSTREDRLAELQRTGFNVFCVRAETIFLDLLSDSGTGAPSDAIKAEIELADERYSHSMTYEKFIPVAQCVFGKPYVLPVHQGRAAENIVFTVLLSELVQRAREKGKPVICLGNTYFDTTFANTGRQGALVINAPCAESKDLNTYHPFKGDADIARMEDAIREYGPENVGFVVMTVVNNTIGGQPVSLANQRAVYDLCKRYGILYILDAARIFENAYMIRQREPGYQDKPIQEIVHEMAALADILLMSGKKDAIANMGGLAAFNDEKLYKLCETLCILIEGHYSYGGMSGRDLAALTQGLIEGMDQEYLRSRINQVASLGYGFRRLGFPIQWPPGSNGIYLDGRGFLKNVDPLFFPAQRICAEVYARYGIRPVEIGLSLAGRDTNGLKVIPGTDLVRFTIPRRVFTGDHIRYILEVMSELHAQSETIGGLAYEREGFGNGHFTSRFRPVARDEIPGLKSTVERYFGTPFNTYAAAYLPPNARTVYSFPPSGDNG